ncbi:MAG TPA: cyclase family protein [Candidatus Polarisedimenticolia bacterium]
MRFIDITVALGPATRTYPGDPPVSIELIGDPARGDHARVSVIRTSLHAGTHVDGPNHLTGGRGGVDSLSLEAMVGPALVVRASGPSIGARDVKRWQLPRRARVLLRGQATLSPDGARELVRRGVLLVGTDGLSVDPIGDPDLPAHRELLRSGVVVLEGLDLSAAPPGRYHLIALPLLIPGADGAPARALLRPRRKTRAARLV